MRAAIIALAYVWLTLAALIGLAVAIGWLADRLSTAERETTVQRVDAYRRRMEWEAQKARAEWRMKQKRKQSGRARLEQFHRKGGTPAA